MPTYIRKLVPISRTLGFCVLSLWSWGAYRQYNLHDVIRLCPDWSQGGSFKFTRNLQEKPTFQGWWSEKKTWLLKKLNGCYKCSKPTTPSYIKQTRSPLFLILNNTVIEGVFTSSASFLI